MLPDMYTEFAHKVLFFKRFFYLSMHERHTERDRDIGRERSRLHAGSPMWHSIPGLQDHALGVKTDAQPLSHPGVPGSMVL